MRRQTMGLAILVTALVLPSAVARPDAPEDVKLYGTWLVTSFDVKGDPKPKPKDIEVTFVLSKGSKAVVMETGKPDGVGTWKVGVTGNVKEIDMAIGGKGDKPVLIKGLYEINGDILKLAFPLAGPDGDRPTAIDPKTMVIMTLKRQKP